MKTNVIQFHLDGCIKCLWTEEIPLYLLGSVKVKRASTIEYDNARGLWQVKINGSSLPSFEASSREACINWEHTELNNALLKGRI